MNKKPDAETGVDHVLVVMKDDEVGRDYTDYSETGAFDSSNVTVERIAWGEDSASTARSRLTELLGERQGVAVVMDCDAAYEGGMLNEVLKVEKETGRHARRFVVADGKTHGDIKRGQKEYGPAAYDEKGKPTHTCRHIHGSEGGHYSPKQRLWRTLRSMGGWF